MREVVQMALGATAGGRHDVRGRPGRRLGRPSCWIDSKAGRRSRSWLNPKASTAARGPTRSAATPGWPSCARWGLGACLADDMGLGKTIQALALLQRDWQQGRASGRCC